jgi:hypothetical protein
MLQWQIRYTVMTDLQQFTINVWKSTRQLQCTLQLLYEYRALLKFKFLYAGSSIQNTS